MRVIDENTMKVIQTWDMSGLEKISSDRMYETYQRGLKYSDEVLNGLSWNDDKGVWLFTGKNWNVVFEVEFDNE